MEPPPAGGALSLRRTATSRPAPWRPPPGPPAFPPPPSRPSRRPPPVCPARCPGRRLRAPPAPPSRTTSTASHLFPRAARRPCLPAEHARLASMSAMASADEAQAPAGAAAGVGPRSHSVREQEGRPGAGPGPSRLALQRQRLAAQLARVGAGLPARGAGPGPGTSAQSTPASPMVGPGPAIAAAQDAFRLASAPGGSLKDRGRRPVASAAPCLDMLRRKSEEGELPSALALRFARKSPSGEAAISPRTYAPAARETTSQGQKPSPATGSPPHFGGARDCGSQAHDSASDRGSQIPPVASRSPNGTIRTDLVSTKGQHVPGDLTGCRGNSRLQAWRQAIYMTSFQHPICRLWPNHPSQSGRWGHANLTVTAVKWTG